MRAHILPDMLRRAAALFVAAVLATGLAHAADDAAAQAAAQAWAKAVMDNDVDAQMKLMPKRLFATPEQRERERKVRMHERERALINREKYVVFDLKPAAAAEQVGTTRVVIFPYRSVRQERDGKMQRDSSLIAIAEGGSDEWTIFDGSAASMKSLKLLIPGYAGRPSVPTPFTRLVKE